MLSLALAMLAFMHPARVFWLYTNVHSNVFPIPAQPLISTKKPAPDAFVNNASFLQICLSMGVLAPSH